MWLTTGIVGKYLKCNYVLLLQENLCTWLGRYVFLLVPHHSQELSGEANNNHHKCGARQGCNNRHHYDDGMDPNKCPRLSPIRQQTLGLKKLSANYFAKKSYMKCGPLLVSHCFTIVNIIFWFSSLLDYFSHAYICSLAGLLAHQMYYIICTCSWWKTKPQDVWFAQIIITTIITVKVTGETVSASQTIFQRKSSHIREGFRLCLIRRLKRSWKWIELPP